MRSWVSFEQSWGLLDIWETTANSNGAVLGWACMQTYGNAEIMVNDGATYKLIEVVAEAEAL